MSLPALVELVAQSFWPGTTGVGNVLNEFRGGDHLAAQLVFELLGETSTCDGYADLSFSSTLMLREPTVRKNRGNPPDRCQLEWLLCR